MIKVRVICNVNIATSKIWKFQITSSLTSSCKPLND